MEAQRQPESPLPEDIAAAADVAGRVIQNVSRVIHAPRTLIERCVIAVLCEGHVILEDFPGVGKTMLAKSIARSLDCEFARVQATPDLLPSDITGVSVFNLQGNEFEFKPGPVFANIVVGDEINRASPKTQSALLECMEERQVTVDGRTYPLTPPFMVIATQNPIEMEGTYPLPEAQRDRFTARISMGYPSAESELAMLDTHGSSSPLDALEPVAQAEDMRELIAAVRTVHVAEPLKQYVIRLVAATRSSPELRLGASPRATLHLLRAGRARAALDGRDFVIPDDMQALALPVLAHRLLPSAEAVVTQQPPERVLAAIVEHLPLPQLR